MAIEKSHGQQGQRIKNRLREKRLSLGLSQKKLADLAGITRQAVCALESNQYSPATSVALLLARALHCRVEDLYSLEGGHEVVEGDLLGSLPQAISPVRAQVAQIGDRIVVRPLLGQGELASLSSNADGLILGAGSRPNRVKVRLLKNREAISRQITIAGCDPAIFLMAGYSRRLNDHTVLPRLMGSGMAIAALTRGEIHVAGVHLTDDSSTAWSVPGIERQVKQLDCLIVTFAHWEEGLMVAAGNPKHIRTVADLARRGISIVNRENGSGARRLLDRQVKLCAIQSDHIKGYDEEVASHLEVASRVKAGLADAGIGIRAVAAIFGLEFIPLQRERYDWIIPRIHYDNMSGVRAMLDTIVDGNFRAELAALGGYDTSETGKLIATPQS